MVSPQTLPSISSRTFPRKPLQTHKTFQKRTKEIQKLQDPNPQNQNPKIQTQNSEIQNSRSKFQNPTAIPLSGWSAMVFLSGSPNHISHKPPKETTSDPLTCPPNHRTKIETGTRTNSRAFPNNGVCNGFLPDSHKHPLQNLPKETTSDP